ncbi:MAG: DUF1343 domain-containing protein [Opitutales bacterium]|nr:DUF1343 domain-containing protein [Opitutales bacterium]
MKLLKALLLLLVLPISLFGQTSANRIYLGIDVLEYQNFTQVKGKRIGLLTHPAGVNRNGMSTIDVLRRAPNVQLVALFGPEHGIYGDEKANVPVDHRVDQRTGLPVYSLYGKYRRPTPEMLRGLDAMVIDLQDLGVRSYTYISCMRYVMEECFKHKVEVIVLDRPNPLGGLKVDGPPMDKEWISYVGSFQVPYVHGLTIGELATMAKNKRGVLDIDEKTRKRGKLTVVPMYGWKRSMQWPQTGLEWKATSPAIPDLSAAMGYSMTGLGAQLGGFVHGYGTRYPFRMLQYTGKTPEQIIQELKRYTIPGLDYRIVTFKMKNGELRRGVYLMVTDWNQLRPTEVSFYMMKIAAKWNREADKGNPFVKADANAAGLFNKHVGSSAFWESLKRNGENVDVAAYIRQWAAEAERFRQESQAYQLYK